MDMQWSHNLQTDLIPLCKGYQAMTELDCHKSALEFSFHRHKKLSNHSTLPMWTIHHLKQR